MSAADHDLSVYLELALAAHRARQLVQRDKLLVLAGAAACRAGLLDLAERSRTIVIERQPLHALARFATFPDALRDPDFPNLLKSLTKFCSVERAEHLLGEEVTPTRDADWATGILTEIEHPPQ